MYAALFVEFQSSSDTLRVYREAKLVFSSQKDRLLPLLEYIGKPSYSREPVIIFDKIMGNAAALLSVKACASEVYSPLGSQLAIKTLERYGIKYHLGQIVHCIQKPGTAEMCPMEKLSLNRQPEEFYGIMKSASQPRPKAGS